MTNHSTKTRLSLHFFGRHFTPKMLPTLFLIFLGPLFCSLGTWQYHRAQTKERLLAEFAQAQAAPPLSVNQLKDSTLPDFYPVNATGKLNTQQSLLVENKFYQHHLGFEVLTPLVLNDGTTLLVNRGWIPRKQAHNLPLTIPFTTTLSGILYRPSQTIFQIGQAKTSETWPKRIQNISWREIHRVTPGWSLRPYLLVLTQKSANQFTPIFQPSIMPPAKHYGYAVQWLAMALALLIIWLVMGFHPQPASPSARE